MSTEGGGASAPSAASSVNEDAYLVHDGLGLYVVADGASQGPAGEIAAQTAVWALEEYVGRAKTRSLASLLRSNPSKGMACKAMRFAMEEVIASAEASEALDGMATTVTMLLVHNDRGVVCHVGDSRLYLWRDGEVHQLTSDHDLAIAPRGHSVDACVHAPIQCFEVKLNEADCFVLCTDGAEDVVENPAAFRLAGAHPREIGARIVAAARRQDPARDATAVVVRVLEEGTPGWLMISEPVWPWAYGHTLEQAYART